MGTKQDDRHIIKAEPREELFTLMARDAYAPYAVIEWIKLSLSNQPPQKLHEALDSAIKMIRTQHQYSEHYPVHFKKTEVAAAIDQQRDGDNLGA